MRAALFALVLGCAPKAGPSNLSGDAVTETIDETTVGNLNGVPVPMGNMTQGSYKLPDGSTVYGWICSLALPDQVGVFVGVGSEVTVGGVTWEVVDIEKEKGKLGSVTLRAMP